MERARLPTAARPDEDDELTVADLEVQLRDRPGPVAVNLRQLVERDLGHARIVANFTKASTGRRRTEAVRALPRAAV